MITIAAYIGFIYFGIWFATRTKLQDEKIKINFLESYFNDLLNVEFDKDTVYKNEIFQNALNEIRKGGKKGTISKISVNIPHNPKHDWRVRLEVKSGIWPINERTRNVTVFSILDSQFEEFEEYISYKSKTAK
tara:strand:- start:111 stop:509 length:399 start_codon:yes stop_codon:yes gene_type:complete